MCRHWAGPWASCCTRPSCRRRIQHAAVGVERTTGHTERTVAHIISSVRIWVRVHVVTYRISPLQQRECAQQQPQLPTPHAHVHHNRAQRLCFSSRMNMPTLVYRSRSHYVHCVVAYVFWQELDIVTTLCTYCVQQQIDSNAHTHIRE